MASRGTLNINNSRFENIEKNSISGYQQSTVNASDIEIRNTNRREAVMMTENSKLTGKNINIFDSGFAFALGLYGGHAEIEDSIFSGGLSNGISLFDSWTKEKSTLKIKNSTTEDFMDTGIGIYKSEANIERTIVRDNIIGIWANGINQINISESSIYGNLEYGAESYTSLPINAVNNWWGDETGPYEEIRNPEGWGDEIRGNINFDPWLTYDPNEEVAKCCSNVLFLPGFMASELFMQGNFAEDQLWPPNSLLKTDVEKLMLDENGLPITPGIYTKGVISEAFGVNVYKSFIERMEDMVSSSKIKEWKSFPYDWRKDLNEIVTEMTVVKEGDDFKNLRLIDEVIALAERSPTGKVTIIGHSNGGLVGKMLIKELTQRGKAEIVDKFVLIATPQLGTPKAIASLLHGDQQEIPPFLGIFMNKEIARELGKNMQSAYNLIPSSKYFGGDESPLITFHESIKDVFDYSAAGFNKEISGYFEVQNFISSPLRGSTLGEQTNVPLSLKSDLIQNAGNTLSQLSTLDFPKDVSIYEIIGAGVDTISSVNYRSKKENICRDEGEVYVCTPESVWDRRLIFTAKGDGTVVLKSTADYQNSSEYYLDLFEMNKSFGFNFKHHNILESPELLDLVKSIATEELNDSSLPQYVSTLEPAIPKSKIQLSVHSPVSIEAIDEGLKFTGCDSSQLNEGFLFIKEEIPNSYYFEIDGDKYIGLDVSKDYEVRVRGLDAGTFTLEAQVLDDGATTQSYKFIDIPVTSNSEYFLEIKDGSLPQSMKVDVDGDGNIDTEVHENDRFDPISYLNMMKLIIKSFELDRSQETDLIVKIDNVIKFLENSQNDSVSKAQVFLKKLDRKFGKMYNGHKKTKLTEEEILYIIQNLKLFINNLIK